MSETPRLEYWRVAMQVPDPDFDGAGQVLKAATEDHPNLDDHRCQVEDVDYLGSSDDPLRRQDVQFAYLLHALHKAIDWEAGANSDLMTFLSDDTGLSWLELHEIFSSADAYIRRLAAEFPRLVSPVTWEVTHFTGLKGAAVKLPWLETRGLRWQETGHTNDDGEKEIRIQGARAELREFLQEFENLDDSDRIELAKEILTHD